MPAIAFEGPAGTGKTYSLMKELTNVLRQRGLQPHERVLALTFMHGSRHRLSTRLQEIECLAGKYRAMTLDSFAYHLCRRWRVLAETLGLFVPAGNDYEATCECAATLLARPIVKSWVCTSYPYLVVDEAQDLSRSRSTMIGELARVCQVLLAFDEFQCLDPELRPIPVLSWLHDICDPIKLDRCYRTESSELLAAAQAVRNSNILELDGKDFRVKSTPSSRGNYAFGATFLANFIQWRKGGNVAVLTPSRKGGFADGIVSLVTTKACGKHRNGPFPIEWQQSGEWERKSQWNDLGIPMECSIPEAHDRLKEHTDSPAVQSVARWIERRRRVLGISRISSSELRSQFNRSVDLQKQYSTRSESRFSAMTIHQAKNREFDHVVVAWPYSTPPSNEQKRRLLYNAITRAKRKCLILVQDDKLTKSPPFVG